MGVGLIVLLCVGFLCLGMAKDPRIAFLSRDDDAQWIRYPLPLQTKARGGVYLHLNTSFQNTFHVDDLSSRLVLHLKAFKRFRVWINGVEAGRNEEEANWKEPSSVDITELVRPGENSIRVVVENSFGPPALWLRSEGLRNGLQSDTTWSVSMLGSAGVPAVVAKDTVPHPISYRFPTPVSSLSRTWPLLGASFFVSVLIFLWHRLVVRRQGDQSDRLPGRFVLTPASVLFLGLFAWLILFVHNLGRLPLTVGFDSEEHLRYIEFVYRTRAIPLADSGGQMYHPPLYYLLSAAVYKGASLLLPFRKAAQTLKLIPFVSGIGQIVLGYWCARLVFPNHPVRQMIVTGVAALIPMNIYMSHYVSNESFSAFLIGLSLTLALVALLRRERSGITFCLLGICLGMALLTKMTSLLLVPGVFAILSYALFVQHRRSTGRVFVFLGSATLIMILVAGWHYVRNWLVFRNPVVGTWDPVTGFLWWQDPGFHTASYFTEFGDVFRIPFFSGFYSFFDSLYATFWGDSLLGGRAGVAYAPPWNYDFMASGYLLAVPAVLAMIIGIACMVRDWLKTMNMGWLILVGTPGALLFGILYMTLRRPYYGHAKAFYGLGMVLPLSLAAGWGLDALDAPLRKRSWHGIRALLWGWFGSLAACVFFSYWIA